MEALIWPTEVTVLTYSQSIGTFNTNREPGEPGTFSELLTYEFNKSPSSNYFLNLEWTSRSLALDELHNNHILESAYQEILYKGLQPPRELSKEPLRIINQYKLKHWNTLQKNHYNVVWTSFGYTENQSEKALASLNYLKNCSDYETIINKPPPSRNLSPYTNRSRTPTKKKIYVNKKVVV